MNSEAFVDKMKSIQNYLLKFLEDESNAEDKYVNFINILSTQQIINEEHELKALLRLINNIGNNHRRAPYFIFKIERLLRNFKKDIQKYFTNSEIFNIFKDNKRILLFLIEEKMITIDEYIFSIFTNEDFFQKKYCEYFQPEIKPFLTKENIEKYGRENESLKDNKFIERMNKEVEEDFYEKRREGENDGYLCQLIRHDKIQEFVTFVVQTNLSLNSYIKKSIFETNPLLIDSYEINLIQYASFFGSIKIVNYIAKKTRNVNSEMWVYSIHSNMAKMIHLLLEDYQIKPNSPKNFLIESIKCHHNEISDYIMVNLIKEEDLQKDIKNAYYDYFYRYVFECYNYCFFPTENEYENTFFYLCEYDYYTLVKLYLAEGYIDINATRIKIPII